MFSNLYSNVSILTQNKIMLGLYLINACINIYCAYLPYYRANSGITYIDTDTYKLTILSTFLNGGVAASSILAAMWKMDNMNENIKNID